MKVTIFQSRGRVLSKTVLERTAEELCRQITNHGWPCGRDGLTIDTNSQGVELVLLRVLSIPGVDATTEVM